MENHSPVHISTTEDLDNLCNDLAANGLLALDSEFIRTDTFFPKPGLLQLSDGREVFLVDPLGIEGWESFRTLIGDNSTTLIVHSSSEDLSLLQHMLGSVPRRLFDTQRAAAFLGHGYSISYQGLVKSEFGIDVPKGETRSDWLRRPLTEQQLSYAVLDVAYLIDLHDRLRAKLLERGMLEWFQQDCAELLLQVKDETLEAEWGRAYTNIGGAWRLEEGQLQLLQKLCYWREARARKRDRPRNWIMKDNELLALATKLGDYVLEEGADGSFSCKMIEDSELFSARFVDRQAGGIVDFLNQAIEFDESADEENLDKPLSLAQRKKLKRCQQLTTIKAQELEIAPELLARKRQWSQLIANYQRNQDDFWPAGLDNWRREILEQDVHSILAS
ncbi:MAG: ribonuclease D [Gammaproteobacteria bacterium]|nr:ribonuclease D [Gammaproteobacteria bacterium]